MLDEQAIKAQVIGTPDKLPTHCAMTHKPLALPYTTSRLGNGYYVRCNGGISLSQVNRDKLTSMIKSTAKKNAVTKKDED